MSFGNSFLWTHTGPSDLRGHECLYLVTDSGIIGHLKWQDWQVTVDSLSSSTCQKDLKTNPTADRFSDSQ